MSEELMVMMPTNPIEIFRPETMNALLARIKEQVKESPQDISTASGRKEIAALAYKIARTKTAIDEAGKRLVEPIKEQAKMIDAERKHARDELDTLKDTVREPLTKYEAADEARKAAIIAKLADVKAIGETEYGSSAQVSDALAKIALSTSGVDFGEYSDAAKQSIELQNLRLEKKRVELAESERKIAEAEKARIEAEKLAESERKAKEEQLRIEREERIRSEAASKAKLEAEQAAAKAEQARAEAARIEAQRKIDDEKRRADEERRRADELVKQAERAKLDAEMAVKREREKVEAQRVKEENERKVRQANIAHREKIIHEAEDAIVATGFIDNCGASHVVEAIINGKIPHVTINF